MKVNWTISTGTAVPAKGRRATTIIEVVMAIIILGVALPGLLTAMTEASARSSVSYQATVASYLAIERMEQIIARRYRATDGYSAVAVSPDFTDETPVSGFTGYNRAVTVTTVNSSLATVGSDEGYKKVRVTVSYNSGADAMILERVFADF